MNLKQIHLKPVLNIYNIISINVGPESRTEPMLKKIMLMKHHIPVGFLSDIFLLVFSAL